MAEHGTYNFRKIYNPLCEAEGNMSTGISREDFFALQGRIMANLSQPGDSLNRLIAHKILLTKLQPVAEDIDREETGGSSEHEQDNLRCEGAIVTKLAKLALGDAHEIERSRQSWG